MRGKKGLSGIVTTLIIILLVLVAVGVIWGVVNNLLSSGTSSLNKNAMCLELDVKATKVVHTAGSEDYNITVFRKATGPDQVVHLKLVLFSDSGNTDVIKVDTQEWGQLRTDTVALTSTGITDANKIQVTPYFIDEDTGKELTCDQFTEFEFADAA